MKAGEKPCVLAVNAGSSSIKFALFAQGEPLQRVVSGRLEGVGSAEGVFAITEENHVGDFSRAVALPNYAHAVSTLMDWLKARVEVKALLGVGHRIVHGGPKYWEPLRVTPQMNAELRKLAPFDPEHLPEELHLLDAFASRFPDLAQVACFDTAFHHAMPRVAQLLAIPRRFEAQGARRYGFHGLSYGFLIGELARLQGPTSRVILAHLGSGASMAAVHDGHSIDTTMGLTPAAGLPMSTRSGDVDPGVFDFLARSEGMSAPQVDHLLSHGSGLLGVSETSADMRALLAREKEDVRAAEAVALFCYQAKKWIGAYAAALGGLDTLVFSGGIGERAAIVRARICDGLGFLGIELSEANNEHNADVISVADGRVSVRVIRTDEEVMIARSVSSVLGLGQ